MSEQVDRAFKEMLDISTDIDKAVLFKGDEVLASNFSESLRPAMVGKAKELAALGAAHATDPGSAPLTQLVVEAPTGTVFVVREAAEGGWGVLATGKKDSRIGLVFYDLKTCIRDAQEPLEPVEAAPDPVVPAPTPVEPAPAEGGEA